MLIPGDWSPDRLLVAFVGQERKRWGEPGFWPGRVELHLLPGEPEPVCGGLRAVGGSVAYLGWAQGMVPTVVGQCRGHLKPQTP